MRSKASLIGQLAGPRWAPKSPVIRNDPSPLWKVTFLWQDGPFDVWLQEYVGSDEPEVLLVHETHMKHWTKSGLVAHRGQLSLGVRGEPKPWNAREAVYRRTAVQLGWL